MEKSIDSSNEAQISHAPHPSNSSGLANSDKTLEKEEEMVPGTFLGVDFGEAKVGLAIADEETRMAFAFDTLKNDKEFWKNLKEIVACENVKTVIIGMTQHGKDDGSAEKKRRFAKMLEAELGIETKFQEEMFTTKMAQDNLLAKGLRGVGKQDDAEAARIILQSWLDR